MTRYFLGVDVGSSKTHAAIADEAGAVVGFGHAGAGNHESVGIAGFQKTLEKAVHGALADANIEGAAISGLGLGVAGYDWPSDAPMMHNVIGTLGLQAPYQFVNDSVIGLIAGARQGWGVSVGAGTGCNACGRTRDGREGRVTGNGDLFGERGGGGQLVRAALAAISQAWSMRGPETSLSKIFVEHFGASDVTNMLEGIARGRYHHAANMAPLVFSAAREGDEVAISVIRYIADGLGDLACGVIRQLDIAGQEFEVVLAGSLYKGSPLIAETMRESIHALAPGAALVRLGAPPVVGAVMLGMEQVQLDFTPLRDQLISTTNKRLTAQNN